MIDMTSDRILLAIIVIDKSVNIVSDYFLKVCFPVFQLLLSMFYEIVRVVSHTNKALIQSVSPNVRDSLNCSSLIGI